MYGKKIEVLYQGNHGKIKKTDKDFVLKEYGNIDGLINYSALFEMAALKKIHSSYVVPLTDIIFKERKTVLVFPYLRTLEKKEMIIRLCLGLADIHNAGFLHLDIKEDNLLEKIIDFGNSHTECSPVDMNYTIMYRAPEILFGEPPSRKSDVWALGVTIANLLLSKDLFSEQTWSGMCDQIDTFFTSDIKGFFLGKGLTEEETSLLTSILVSDPDKRPSIFKLLGHSYFKVMVPVEWNCFEIFLRNSKKIPNKWLDLKVREKCVRWLYRSPTPWSFTLAVNFLDRIAPVNDPMLYTYACYFIGFNYHSSFLPDRELEDLPYPIEQINAIIKEVLISVSFDLTMTTPFHFLSWYYDEVPREVITLWKKEILLASYFDHPLEVAERIIKLIC